MCLVSAGYGNRNGRGHGYDEGEVAVRTKRGMRFGCGRVLGNEAIGQSRLARTAATVRYHP